MKNVFRNYWAIAFMALAAAGCQPKTDPQLIDQLTAIQQKLDSLSSEGTDRSSYSYDLKGTQGKLTHVPGHIIDPPDTKGRHGDVKKMAKIKLDADYGVDLLKGQEISGINTRGIKFVMNDQVGFHVAYMEINGTKTYVAYDICFYGRCHCNCAEDDSCTDTDNEHDH